MDICVGLAEGMVVLTSTKVEDNLSEGQGVTFSQYG